MLVWIFLLINTEIWNYLFTTVYLIKAVDDNFDALEILALICHIGILFIRFTLMSLRVKGIQQLERLVNYLVLEEPIMLFIS